MKVCPATRAYEPALRASWHSACLDMLIPRADIDAAFRVIAEYFYQMGMILSVEEFIAALKDAWGGGAHMDHTYVGTVDVVFDYKEWFDGVVYDAIEPTLCRADTNAQAAAPPPPPPSATNHSCPHAYAD